MCLKWKQEINYLSSRIRTITTKSAEHGLGLAPMIISPTYIAITAIDLSGTFLIHSPQSFHVLRNFVPTDSTNDMSCFSNGETINIVLILKHMNKDTVQNTTTYPPTLVHTVRRRPVSMKPVLVLNPRWCKPSRIFLKKKEMSMRVVY